MKHPNAKVAAGGSGLSVLVVWVLGHFHVALSAEAGAIIAGAVASVALFIGREGIKGAWRRLINGQDGVTIIELVIVLIAVGVLLLLLGKTF